MTGWHRRTLMHNARVRPRARREHVRRARLGALLGRELAIGNWRSSGPCARDRPGGLDGSTPRAVSAAPGQATQPAAWPGDARIRLDPGRLLGSRCRSYHVDRAESRLDVQQGSDQSPMSGRDGGAPTPSAPSPPVTHRPASASGAGGQVSPLFNRPCLSMPRLAVIIALTTHRSPPRQHGAAGATVSVPACCRPGSPHGLAGLHSRSSARHRRSGPALSGTDRNRCRSPLGAPPGPRSRARVGRSPAGAAPRARPPGCTAPRDGGR
jgi:hypothetical protein